MMIEKAFTGTLNFGTTTRTFQKSYGITSSTITVNVDKTDFLNNTIKDFLNECGVDCEYRDNYLWVCGVPITIYFTGTNVYWTYSFPFDSTNYSTTASTTSIFSGTAYNFKIFAIGNPKGTFSFMLTTYGGSSYQSATIFNFMRGKNIFNDEPVVLYSKSNTAVFAIGFNEDGSPKDIGHCSSSNQLNMNLAGATDYLLPSLLNDFNNNSDKFPLVQQMAGIFVLVDCFRYPQNFGLPASGTIVSTQQKIVTINGEDYWIAQNWLYVGLVKCT